MHPFDLPVRRTAAGFAIAILVAACSGGSSTAAPSNGTSANGAVANADAPITITAPADGAQVSLPFQVQVASNEAIGTPETGDHHVHLYYDTDTSAADYDIVYGTSWQVTRPLAPGAHTIIAALANPDHSLAGPTTTIHVTVTAAGAGARSSGPSGASAAPSAPASAPPAPGY